MNKSELLAAKVPYATIRNRVHSKAWHDEVSRLKGLGHGSSAAAAEATRAFFDFNGSCGSESVTAPTRDGTRAFFDFNGSCGGSSISDARRGEALVNALRDIMR